MADERSKYLVKAVLDPDFYGKFTKVKQVNGYLTDAEAIRHLILGAYNEAVKGVPMNG